MPPENPDARINFLARIGSAIPSDTYAPRITPRMVSAPSKAPITKYLLAIASDFVSFRFDLIFFIVSEKGAICSSLLLQDRLHGRDNRVECLLALLSVLTSP